jgi:hypothetical protein
MQIPGSQNDSRQFKVRFYEVKEMASEYGADSHGRAKQIDKILTLGEVERRLRVVMANVPSRSTLIGYVESGKLRGSRNPFNKYYYVFQSSLETFIDQILSEV